MYMCTAGCSDGWLLNLTACLLRLARPFVNGWLARYATSATRATGGSSASASWGAGAEVAAKYGDLFEKHLTPLYYSLYPHRVGNTSGITPLTGTVCGAAVVHACHAAAWLLRVGCLRAAVAPVLLSRRRQSIAPSAVQCSCLLPRSIATAV